METLFGKLSSGWKIEGKKLTLEVVVPPNTTATVYVPSKQGESVKEGSVLAAKAPGIKELGWENGAAVYQVGSGSYKFSVRCE